MNIKQLTAADLMTSQIISIGPNETLRTAARLLNKHHIHCLVVPLADRQRCVGVITTKDIVQVLCDGEPKHLDQLLVQDAMTSPSVSVQKRFSILDCVQLMRMAGVRSAPVLDGVELVGLLSFTDVLRAAAIEPQ